MGPIFVCEDLLENMDPQRSALTLTTIGANPFSDVGAPEMDSLLHHGFSDVRDSLIDFDLFSVSPVVDYFSGTFYMFSSYNKANI